MGLEKEEQTMPGVSKVTEPTAFQYVPLGVIQVKGTATGDRAGGGRIEETTWPVDAVIIQVGSNSPVTANLSNYNDVLNTTDFTASITLAAPGNQTVTVISSLRRPDFSQDNHPLTTFKSAPFTVEIVVAGGPTWAFQRRISGVGTSAGPALAVFPYGELSLLNAVWKGQLNDAAIYWSSFDGSNWAASQQRINGVGTSAGPALAVFNNRLYAAWKGELNDVAIYWSSFDGSNWASQQRINGVGTSAGPSLSYFTGDNRLYIAWKGELDDVAIYWSALG
jgi:hypothetical protein